ncbi:Transcriptional regulator, GntR family (plasmid) [Neorhizobium galegae bv. officinalis bv. officinalis str. HAMBI 1141]|uniref:Transcriptional regulator, GntR family n=1 Tax=Neorhizobium galegae bv. officinalis bv. officinalis str. HAMBI 1141 TaxID=1028801 RepID=A0A068TGT2_NEOGA|nr:GntR family transcriptional regulator [Neorhizobium galegae]CDN57657.1 Transcriptional regulator, GntR family [Neorhizobium galegae bv. officinalis bv. officinalis str. HAMBI 1141]
MSDGPAVVPPRWCKDAGGAGPRYHRLRMVIEKAILSGELKEGEVLCPERDLADHVQVSRVTVRKAIDHLVRDGFLARRPDSGTFVAGSTVRAHRLLSYASSLIRHGCWPGSKIEWIERSTSHPSPEEMMTLGLPGDSRVARLGRLRSSAGRPLAIERTSISVEFLGDTFDVTSSIYKALADADFRPVRAIQRILACNIDDPDASMLGVTIGAAGLLTKRVAYLASGRAIEFTSSLFRGDADCFVTELTNLDN